MRRVNRRSGSRRSSVPTRPSRLMACMTRVGRETASTKKSRRRSPRGVGSPHTPLAATRRYPGSYSKWNSICPPSYLRSLMTRLPRMNLDIPGRSPDTNSTADRSTEELPAEGFPHLRGEPETLDVDPLVVPVEHQRVLGVGNARGVEPEAV